MTPQSKDGYPATPMGVFTLDYVFGTAAIARRWPAVLQVGPDDWWDGDANSPTFNTHQHLQERRSVTSTHRPAKTSTFPNTSTRW